MLEEEKLKVIKKRLKEGLLLNTNMVMEFIGGKNPFERSDFVFNKKEMLSLKDFNESRDYELTQELLNSLDKMNMSEIHARFFNGGIELW